MSHMIESLAQDRHAQRYQDARVAAARGETPGRMRGTRTRAGWLLVGLGLRLALPGRQDAARRITLIGR
jgi:hypothetical protein